jgi:oxygen-dependent protoporphyrinogen oxidase
MGRERTVVIGAGLSGLSCAFDLKCAGQDVVVLEASARCGGVVDTVERDGFLFETGPHTVPASTIAFTQLCADLGISDRLRVAHSGPRYLWFKGHLVALPSSPLALMSTPLLSRAAKWHIFSEPWHRFVPPVNGAPEPTFEAFLEGRVGRETTRRLAGAFVRGIWAAEIGELGARSAFPRVWELASRHGGLVRGALASRKRSRKARPGPISGSMSLLSFQRGFGELVAALERALDGCIELQSPVERITRIESGWSVVCSGNRSTYADHVALCVPAPAAAAWLEPAIGAHVDLSFLRSIAHASVTVVHLGFARGVTLPKGFGYLVPPDVDDRGAVAPRALGTLFASNLLDGRTPRGGASIASFYRGSDVADLDATRLIELAAEDLRLVLGVSDGPRPDAHCIRRFTDVIPRYAPEHDRRIGALLDDLREREPGLHLGGAFTGGVSVGAVLARGRAVAREVLFQEAYA